MGRFRVPAGAAFLAAATCMAAAGEAREPAAGVFRYVTQATPAPSSCVGVFLERGLAVTAAHCLRGGESSLRVLCGHADLVLPLRTAMRHPTHDVAIAAIDPGHPCPGEALSIAREVSRDDRLTAAAPVILADADAGIRVDALSVRETARDAHTIIAIVGGACLSPGDSGVPLLIEDDLGDTRLAGVLIAGDEGCGGEQVFVRLDALGEWMTAAMQGVIDR
jgi:hypothetical protein